MGKVFVMTYLTESQHAEVVKIIKEGEGLFETIFPAD